MRLLITGGGTGGHVYPGVAVAREVLRRSPDSAILFVGATRGVETRIVPHEGFMIETLDVTGLKGRGVGAKAASLIKLLSAITKAVGVINRYKPSVVLGVGGYASGAMGLACAITGTPLCIAEQNATPGLTNRWLAKVAKKIFLTLPDKQERFPAAKTVLTGNPIRPDFFETVRKEENGKLNLLVIGGSQGAHSINNALIEAVAGLNDMAGNITVVHQTGAPDLSKVKKAYEAATFDWEANDFYHDMPQRLANADLIVSRAGAGAVAEICAVGRVALYVPFPQAADDHQTKNAQAMVDAGAALLYTDATFSGDELLATTRRFTHDKNALEAMAHHARAMARPDAARHIVDHLEELSRKAA